MRLSTYILSLLLFLQLCFLNTMAQTEQTIYYGANGKIVSTEADADTYVVIEAAKKDRFRSWNYYQQDGKWIKYKFFTELIPENDSVVLIKRNVTKKKSLTTTRIFKQLSEDSYYIKDYREDGELMSEGYSKSIFPLHKNGEYKEYHLNGKLASISQNEDNQELSNQNWNPDGKETRNNVFTIVDEMPQFEGGEDDLLNHLGRNIRYPQYAKESGIQGIVYITFIIMEDGSMEDVTVLRGIGGGCDKESIRVVKSLENWTPGKLNGKPVKVQFNLPVRFVLR